MCVDHSMICRCGTSLAGFNFKDEVMPAEVISRLYCPKCSGAVSYDPSVMLKDNGWIIEYDMEVARFMGQRLPSKALTPDYLFDEGYCTWRGVYPTDHIDIERERQELVNLAKINRKKYIEEFKRWGVARMERLQKEGWRKAREI